MRQRSEIQKKINDITFQLKLIEVSTKNTKNKNSSDDAIELALSKDQRLHDATTRLAKLQAEQNDLEKAINDKEKDPSATRIREAIEVARKQIEDIKHRVRQQVADGLKQQAPTRASAIERLQLERELMLAQLKDTESQIDAQAENIQKLEKFNGDADQLRADITKSRASLRKSPTR